FTGAPRRLSDGGCIRTADATRPSCSGWRPASTETKPEDHRTACGTMIPINGKGELKPKRSFNHRSRVPSGCVHPVTGSLLHGRSQRVGSPEAASRKHEQF